MKKKGSGKTPNIVTRYYGLLIFTSGCERTNIFRFDFMGTYGIELHMRVRNPTPQTATPARD